MAFSLPRKQLSPAQIRRGNSAVVSLMSDYLNLSPAAATPEDLAAITACGVDEEFAFAEFLAAWCGLDNGGVDRDFYRNYFPEMVHRLDPTPFREDPYYKLVTERLAGKRHGKWECRKMRLAPCEAFVCGDFKVTSDLRLIPQIGFFPEEYAYPAILEDGREWMTLLPNETITTLPAVAEATGKVLTYGLGLGYFAFMAARKAEVSSVTVVELSPDAIALFREVIAPLLPAETVAKIHIIQSDAFDYAEKEMPRGNFDFVFADIWHDVGDGRALYLRMKEYEKTCPGTVFRYWLSDSIDCYLDDRLWPERT